MHGRQEGGHYSEHTQSSGPAHRNLSPEAAALAQRVMSHLPAGQIPKRASVVGRAWPVQASHALPQLRLLHVPIMHQGVAACSAAGTFPKDNGERTCNVCLACDDAANAFRAALVSGDADAARRVYGTCDTRRWRVAQRLTSTSCCPEPHLNVMLPRATPQCHVAQSHTSPPPPQVTITCRRLSSRSDAVPALRVLQMATGRTARGETLTSLPPACSGEQPGRGASGEQPDGGSGARLSCAAPGPLGGGGGFTARATVAERRGALPAHRPRRSVAWEAAQVRSARRHRESCGGRDAMACRR